MQKNSDAFASFVKIIISLNKGTITYEEVIIDPLVVVQVYSSVFSVRKLLIQMNSLDKVNYYSYLYQRAPWVSEKRIYAPHEVLCRYYNGRSKIYIE